MKYLFVWCLKIYIGNLVGMSDYSTFRIIGINWSEQLNLNALYFNQNNMFLNKINEFKVFIQFSKFNSLKIIQKSEYLE